MMRVRRKWAWLPVSMALGVLVLLAFNNWHYREYLKHLATLRSEMVPVNLRLAVTDQIGAPVRGCKIAVRLHYVPWYYSMFPLMASIGESRGSRHVVKTDREGNVRVKPFLGSAYSLSLEEIPGQNYRLPSNQDEAENPIFNNDPRGGSVSLRQLGFKEQDVHLRLLRHGELATVVRYRPETAARQDGIEVEASEENVFALDLQGNKVVEGRYKGALILTIMGAKKACDVYKNTSWGQWPRDNPLEWSISLDGQEGAVIQDAGDVSPTFAPREGYKRRLVYRLAATNNPPRGAVGFVGNLERIRSFSTTEAAETYYLTRAEGHLSRLFYLNSKTPAFSAFLEIQVDLLPEGKIVVRTHGYYNPDGSPNLWVGGKL